MVDVSALRHDVVKRSTPRVNRVGDEPDHREGHEERDRGEKHALVRPALEVRRVEVAGRARSRRSLQGAIGPVRQHAWYGGEGDQAEDEREEPEAPVRHAIMLTSGQRPITVDARP